MFIENKEINLSHVGHVERRNVVVDVYNRFL